ncbi:MAG: hypothetical protein K2X52_06630 [Mycobacteriaceae bacterium]|nr:hypothetical protein [Mycobacteriaceae bacterium]
MSRYVPDRFDDLRREWIADHAGIFTIQKRRAERLNRQIRRRNRVLAGARPNPYDDNTIHPLWARRPTTVEGWLELAIIAAAAALVPIGWPVGVLMYQRLIALIPTRLRSYPIPALLWTAVGIGTLCALLYTPDDSLSTALYAPYLLAQIPAAFAVAGLYGILNGWLAVDGSTDWWPLTPPPISVDLDIPMGPDDMTAPPVFATADAEHPGDLRPTGGSRGSVRLVIVGLLICAIGSAWMTGAVIAGVKDVVTQSVTTYSG